MRSSSGWHVVLVEDVREALEPTLELRSRTFRRVGQNLGRVGGATVRRHFPRGAAGDDDDGTEAAAAAAATSSFFIETHGCQMNKSDSERMAGQLLSLGLRPSDSARDADVLVFNTCSIREHAEHKLYSQLGGFARRKWSRPHALLVVAGCVAQQEAARLARRVPEVDLVLGPQFVPRLAELLRRVVDGGSQLVATDVAHIGEDGVEGDRDGGDAAAAAGVAAQPLRADGVSAWVNVIYGCNERCTYCVVPNTRGVEQSRTMSSIRREIEALAKQGYREVTLLGQNTDAYGRDLSPRVTFTDLLYAVHDVEGIERIRFTTSHPRYFSRQLVRACRELPKVCESFNVPFQSGDDGVLRDMRRGYSVRRYRQVIQHIREELPDASITADAIVGFPGESEQGFENTLALMELVQFDHVHTAAYSARPFTPAAEMEAQVPDEVKEQRLQRILRRNEVDARARNQRYLGRVEEVLVSEANPRDPTQVRGRTRTNRVTYFDGDIELLRGKLVPVRITGVGSFAIRGEQALLENPGSAKR